MKQIALLLTLLAAPGDDVTLPGLEDKDAGLTKEEVLKSGSWRQTMLTLSTWFDTQKLYSPEQVLEFKREINRRVREMSPQELLRMQHEITDKLAVLNGPAAQEVKTYLREQLSLASDAYRKRMLAHLPDVARMSADEIQDYLNRFIAKTQAESRASKEFLQAKSAQAQMVIGELNQQRQAADRAIDSAVRSGGWGGNGGVIGAKNVTGGQIPTAAGYYSSDFIGWGGWGGWGHRW
jgi:hypothetical protein